MLAGDRCRICERIMAGFRPTSPPGADEFKTIALIAAYPYRVRPYVIVVVRGDRADGISRPTEDQPDMIAGANLFERFGLTLLETR